MRHNAKLSIRSVEKKEMVQWVEAGVGVPPKISAQAWKDFGYWARPTVNTVPVNNSCM